MRAPAGFRPRNLGKKGNRKKKYFSDLPKFQIFSRISLYKRLGTIFHPEYMLCSCTCNPGFVELLLKVGPTALHAVDISAGGISFENKDFILGE